LVVIKSVNGNFKTKRCYKNTILLSLKISLWATLFVLITGLPFAYIIARYNFFGKSIIEALIDILIMIPHTAAGIALVIVFGKGTLSEIFEAVGIKFVNTEFGIMIAIMFLSFTFLINGAKERFKKMDVKLEKVARSLGVNSLQVFLKGSIPNAKKI